MQNYTVPRIKELLFITALALKPLYIGRSGTIQISDLIYIVLLFLCLFDGRVSFMGPMERKWTRIFGFLIEYQIIVNIIAYIVNSNRGYTDVRFIRVNLFYIFNFLVCLTVFQMCTEVGYQRLLKLYLIGSAISVAVCYIGILFNYSGAGREKGFFNNPNQLGYFAIIIMTIFVIYCRQIRRVYRITMIALCLILNVLSLSKASIIGSAVLLIMYALISSDERGVKRTLTIIVLVSIVAVSLYLIMYADIGFLTNNYHISAMRRRLSLMSHENDSNLATGRGYDRLKEIGVWILTGVGEGAFTRFKAASGKELHSMYASTIACYGLIGFTGYVYLFKQALFSDNRNVFSIMAFSGVFLYCMTHNGVRNTLLWTLVAMLLLRPYGHLGLNDDVRRYRVAK